MEGHGLLDSWPSCEEAHLDAFTNYMWHSEGNKTTFNNLVLPTHAEGDCFFIDNPAVDGGCETSLLNTRFALGF